MLAESGADEFYCGLTPAAWLTDYNVAVWLNRRSPRGANLTEYDALGTLVERAHRYRVPVSLTLNAPQYTQAQLALVLDVARKASEIGVDTLIVADPALLLALRDEGSATPVHVSSLGAGFNTEAIGFYGDLGASRVILPRDLSLSEIALIVSRLGDRVESEVFVLNDGCAHTEAFCLTSHSVGDAFCYRDWVYTFRSAGSREARGDALAERALLDGHYRDYREWVRQMSGACTVSDRGFQNGACGLCAIDALYRMGITSIKIAGRQAPPLRKLLSLKLVKAVLDKVATGAAPEDITGYAQALRATPNLCGSGYMCYYR